jgi:hypothetical protein
VHRNLFKELGGYDERFKYYGDYDFILCALQREPFARISQTLSGCHRHGSNASTQQTPVHWASTKQIMKPYAPSSPWKQVTYRYLLKTWANGTNPTAWFARKRIGGLRPLARALDVRASPPLDQRRLRQAQRQAPK